MFAPSCSPVCLHSLRPTWSPIQYIHAHPILIYGVYDVSMMSRNAHQCVARGLMQLPWWSLSPLGTHVKWSRSALGFSWIFLDASNQTKLTTCAPNKGWMRSERLQKIVSVDSLVKLPSCSPVGVDCNKVTVPDFQSALPQDASSYGAGPRLFDPWFSWSVVLEIGFQTSMIKSKEAYNQFDKDMIVSAYPNTYPGIACRTHMFWSFNFLLQVISVRPASPQSSPHGSSSSSSAFLGTEKFCSTFQIFSNGYKVRTVMCDRLFPANPLMPNSFAGRPQNGISLNISGIKPVGAWLV